MRDRHTSSDASSGFPVLSYIDNLSERSAKPDFMTKREQRALAAGFITLEDTLHRTEDALQNGSVEQALAELQEAQHAIAAMRPR